jgi:MFS-type transporter involved in bile tolerance (Atg22 family)
MSNRQTTARRFRFLPAFSWILYDFANTIYSMNVVTMYFSLWITVNLAREDIWVGASNSISMALVAVSLPVLGAIADFRVRRKAFLWWFTFTCAAATAAIGIIGHLLREGTLQVLLASVLFVIANYAYQGGLAFYNALLPSVATRETMGRISGYGVGAGYLGAIVGLLLVMPFVQGEISFLHLQFPSLQGKWVTVGSLPEGTSSYVDTDTQPNANYRYRIVTIAPSGDTLYQAASSKDTVIVSGGTLQRAVVINVPEYASGQSGHGVLLQRQESGWGRVGSFIPTGLLFLLFALPIFLFVREQAENGRKPLPGTRQIFQDVWESLSNTRKYPGVLRFLIAKFFYEEGIQTAIIFMAVYAVKVMGFPNEVIIPFFMLTTTAAAAGSVLFGWFTDRFGPKPTLQFVIGSWVVCLSAVVLVNEKIWFWILGSLIGIFMGSTWTSARPLFIRLVPEEKLAEFFGLYALSGKAAAIVGPLIWSLVVAILAPYGDQFRYRGAVFSLTLLMLTGFLLLWKVPHSRPHSTEKLPQTE